jgi:hypothetical protein
MKSGEDGATRIAATSASGWQTAGVIFAILGTSMILGRRALSRR